MPLVRLQVRNEYGLGRPELYTETNREDPKAVLDGVAVAGLVGILRQLGDLADFAAEVFHGLQEQVMTTASRSHKLMVRIQKIEASLPPLEKAILAQTSHIHFAYTAGCEWHPCIKPARNHFIYNDLPQFIMDSYEECREPPHMHLLDKFDTGGTGSCLRRYSDPTFFKRVSVDLDESYSEKTERARKTHKNKKKRSSQRNGEHLRGEQMNSSSSRMQFISPTVNGRNSSSQTASTIDMTVKSDLEDHSNSFDSRAGAGYIECVFHPSNSMQSDEQDCQKPSSSTLTQETNTLQPAPSIIDDSISHDSMEKQIASSSSGVTWDEKEEIVESESQACDRDKNPERLLEKQDSYITVNEAVAVTNIYYNDILCDKESNLKPVSSRVQTDDIDSEPDNYMDARNSIESESENDLDYERKREVEKFTSHVTHGMVENGVTEATSNLLDNNLSDVVLQMGSTVSLNKETGRDFPDSLQENPPVISEPHASNLGSVSPSIVIASKEMTRDSKETFRGLPDSLPEISPLISEPHESNLGCASPADVPLSKEITKDLDDSHSSESPVCEQVPHTCGNSVLDSSGYPDSLICAYPVNATVSAPIETDISFPGSGSYDLPAKEAPIETDISFPGSKSNDLPDEEAPIETDVSFSSSKSYALPEQDAEINSNICKSEETPRNSTGDNSVRFWTNGRLLGLEPSKPPDFTMSSSLSQGLFTTESEMDGGSSHNSVQKGNGYKQKQDLSEEVAGQVLKEPSSRCLTSSHDDDQTCTSAKNSGSSQLSNGFGPTERDNMGEIRVVAPGCVVPAAPSTKATKACTEPNQGNSENSSRVFGLSHRLLINSFHQKVSFDEKSGPYNTLKNGILEQSGQSDIERKSLPETTFAEQVGLGYPIDSLPPSPPLEQMKISFYPVCGFETSKLKLKFPDGTNHHGSIRDMFTTFQLVPEPSIPLDDSGSHSDDDDTFCRSSPYVSDDCVSPCSEYNSDQWESNETPESSDHGVYDSPHRRTSTGSMLSTKELGGVSNVDINVASGHGAYTPNGVEPSLSGPLLDFPSFDNVNPVLEQESNMHSECNNVVKSQSHGKPTPPPPPLPSKQWWGLKPQLDMINGTQHYMSEDDEQINDLSLSESTFFQQPRLAEVEQTQINHDGHKSHDNILLNLKDKLDQQKLNGQKEANQVKMGKEMDEREDFLHQIRTKSFNLRRTVTEKPNATTSPTTNVKVTAILEKANAIRQVVASDDGEDDDNWSDT